MFSLLILLRDAIVAVALSWIGLGEEPKDQDSSAGQAPSSSILFGAR